MMQNVIKKTEYSLFMKYTVFVLLFCSLAYMTIFTTTIPGYNLIASLLLISVILLRLNTLVVTKIGTVFLLLASAAFIIYYKASFGALSAFVVSFLVAITALNLRREEVELFVKTYINMIFIFATASILGFLFLYVFPFGESICQQTFILEVEPEYLWENDYRLYNFPCYLGLSEVRYTGVLQDQLILDFNLFGGFSRSSSFSSEPGKAGFFMMPAIIFLLFGPLDQTGIKEKIKLFVITLSLAIVIASFLTLFTIIGLYIFKILVNSKFYKLYLFFLIFFVFLLGILGPYILTYMRQYFINTDLPYFLIKLLVNEVYFKNLVYFSIPMYFFVFWLIRKTRSYIKRNHYYSIYFLIAYLSHFVYLFKNPEWTNPVLFIYGFTGFFQQPSFWLWCALYVCAISIRFNKSYSY